MPLCHAFKVTEITKGDLKVDYIEVLHGAITGSHFAVPKGVEPGTVCTLRLTPSKATLHTLRDNQKEARLSVSVFGYELAVIDTVE